MSFIVLLRDDLKKIVIVILSIFFYNQTFSQIVNIENKRIYDDTLGWSGSLDGGFSAIQNKELLLNANFRPKVQFKTKRHYILFLTDLYYSKSTEKVFANSGVAHLRYSWRFNSKKEKLKSPWKWESYVQIQYNQLLDQRLRALVGSGLRIKVLDKKGYRIFAGTSMFYEYEEIRTSSVINKDFRLSNYLSCFLNPKPNFSFTAVTYFQPLGRDFSDFRVMSQYALNFNMFKRTDFRFEVNQFFDSNPPIGVRKFIFNSALGLHVRLGS